MSGRRSLPLLLALAWIGCGAPAPQPDRPPLPELSQIADFALTERSGSTLERQDLHGYIWIADFIFTNCAGPCPVMTARMAELQQQLPLKKGIRLVSFSVDPERDTPEVLSRYADQAGARPGVWYFLTGPRERIHRLAAESFKLGSLDDPLIHSTRFVLVDRLGVVRGYYDSQDTEALEALRRDVQRLIQEPA